MNITNEMINEIRNKTDIVDIISNYVPLNQRGKNYFGVCPFHDDHSPSMSVSKEKQIYTCFSYKIRKNLQNTCMSLCHGIYYLRRVVRNIRTPFLKGGFSPTLC